MVAHVSLVMLPLVLVVSSPATVLLLLLLLVLGGAGAVNTAPGAAARSYDNCMTLSAANRFIFRWSIRNDSVLEGAIEANTTGYVAIGLSLDGRMNSGGRGTDMIVGWVDNNDNQQQVYDYFATARSLPLLDAEQNVRLVSGFKEENSLLRIEFDRNLNTFDSCCDYVISKDNNTARQYFLLWALSDRVPTSSTAFSRHTAKGSSIQKIDFFASSNPLDTCNNNNHNSGGGNDNNDAAAFTFVNADKTYKLSWNITTNVDDDDGDHHYHHQQKQQQQQQQQQQEEEDNRIEFTITASTLGWIGLGFKDNNNNNNNNNNGATPPSSSMSGMRNADMIIAWVSADGTTAFATDRSATSNSLPPLDSSDQGCTNDVTILGGSQDTAAGTTTVRFSRRLKTGDTKCDVDINEFDMVILWAIGSDDPSSADGSSGISAHKSKGFGVVNFFQGTANTSSKSSTIVSNMKRAHGIIMVLSWPLAISFGSLIARYGKSKALLGSKWFHLHIPLQAGGTIASFLGICIVVAGVYLQNISSISAVARSFFGGPHQVLGGLVFLGAVLQCVLGVLADRMFDKSRASVPIFPDRVHWWLARICMLASYVAVFLGMYLLYTGSGSSSSSNNNNNNKGWFIFGMVVFALWILWTLFVVVLLEFLVGPSYHVMSKNNEKATAHATAADNSNSSSNDTEVELQIASLQDAGTPSAPATDTIVSQEEEEEEEDYGEEDDTCALSPSVAGAGAGAGAGAEVPSKVPPITRQAAVTGKASPPRANKNKIAMGLLMTYGASSVVMAVLVAASILILSSNQ